MSEVIQIKSFSGEKELDVSRPPLILIVDDVAKNLQVLGFLLKQQNYQIAAATSGGQALRILEDIKPDLILLDIMMPEIDGYEVCRRLQQNPDRCEIPVIFLTAKTETEDLVIGFEAGAVDYLTKPFNSAELFARVRTHIDLKRSRDELKRLNARLTTAFDDIALLHSRLADEMKDAHDVQAAFLPTKTLLVDGYEVAGSCQPAREVGGDFYDFLNIGDEKTMIMLGDVSGKGMPAALVMAVCRSVIVSQAYQDFLPGANNIVSLLNKIIFEDTDAGMFVTCFLGVWDNLSGKMEYCSAGHNPPFLVRKDGSIETLEPTGPLLGFSDQLKFDQAEIQLCPEDVLFIYSDGITEARNVKNEMFGEERVREVLLSQRKKDAEIIHSAILHNLKEFASGVEQSDDITVAIIKRCRIHG